MYTLKEKHMSLNDRYQVIVIGGGPAGCSAALSAAREGAKTLLIEGTSALGGMGTNGLVTSWCPFSDREKMVYRGLAETIFTKAKAGIRHIKQTALDWVTIDPEYLKRVYDDMMEDAGVDVLFNTFLGSAETDGNQNIDVLITSNKSGLTAYKADIYIDTTGDADLVAFAGGAYEKGDDWNDDLQPATHCFILSNVDDYGFNHGPWLNKANKESPVYKIAASDRYPLIEDAHACAKLLGPGTVGFNAGHLVGVDQTDPASASKAYIKGRRIASQFKEGLKEFFPEAFGNAFLATTATLMGIRETRRIVGDYVLSLEDYASRRTFEDEICRNSYFLDVHHPKHDDDPDRKAYYDRIKDVKHYGKGESHGIPYRCLIPKSFKNVLVAGRAISVERIVQGSVRVMPVCLAMGEAAGMAAAHAVKAGNDTRKIDIRYLRQRLKEEGAYIL